MLEVRSVVLGDFAVKFRVRSKVDEFQWALVAVYGAAQLELKPDFLADLVSVCGDERLQSWLEVILTLLGGETKRITITLMADGHSCLTLSSKVLARER
jgi:hypothetical protein